MRTLQITLAAAVALLAACRATAPRAQAPEPHPIEFEMQTFEKSRPGCGDHGNHTQACVSFRASWPVMKGGAGETASRMNTAVLTALGFPGGPAAMDPFSEELIERWRVEHRGIVYADSTWFERRAVQVLARRPGVWSFQVDRVGQTGDALPFSERTYLNLDPRTGSPTPLSALIEKDAEARLVAAAEMRLRAALDLNATAPLPLKDGAMRLPRQFALTSAGIVLAWTGEELSTAGASPVEITLPWSQARDLVRDADVKPPSGDREQGF